MIWTTSNIEALGFKLIANQNKWCHFRGHGFDVYINLCTKVTDGNLFNFHSDKSSYKGHFRATIKTEEEFKTLLRIIQ